MAGNKFLSEITESRAGGNRYGRGSVSPVSSEPNEVGEASIRVKDNQATKQGGTAHKRPCPMGQGLFVRHPL